MTFEKMNLDPAIMKALVACGYTIPTPIQVRSIPDVLNGKDLVASAQTGTGKTAAFVLPALHKLTLTKGTSKPRILVLTPTRELAAQITQAAHKYGKFLRFNIVSLVGGMPYRQQLRELSRPVDIIVATPGRLLDHMKNHKLDLSAVEMLVLDEADRMLDMGFIDDVKDIAKVTPASRQTLLFSATVDNNLSGIIRQLLKDPIRIDLSNVIMAPALIKQEAYIADNNQHKERLLQHFIKNENIYKAIIFSGTKINADYLARRLRDMDFEAAALHGDLKQNVRNKTIEQFRRGRIQFLVATDVAARGIDINDVTHVINYDLPKFSEDYVHRIGRTGRAGRTGIAISLVLPVDARHLQKIEKYIGEKLPFSTIPGLEPTKKMHNSAANPTGGKKKKFGGNTRGGFKSSGYGSSKPKTHDSRGYAARKGVNKEEGRSEFRSTERRSEGRGRSANYSEGRSERRTESRSPRSENRFESRGESRSPHNENRSEGRFEGRSAGRSNRGENHFEGRSEGRSHHSAPRSESRGQYEPRSGGRGRGEGRSEGSRDENRQSLSKRPEGRAGFAKRKEFKSDDRSNFAPRGDFKSGDGKRKTFKKLGDTSERFEARKTETPRRTSSDPRISYATRDKGAAPRGRGARGASKGGSDFRGKPAGRSFAKGSDDKNRRARRED